MNAAQACAAADAQRPRIHIALGALETAISRIDAAERQHWRRLEDAGEVGPVLLEIRGDLQRVLAACRQDYLLSLEGYVWHRDLAVESVTAFEAVKRLVARLSDEE